MAAAPLGVPRPARRPAPGLRIIAPDLPGYGWSGPAPHRWAKDDVANDVLALIDALGLDRVLLVGHDWGAYVGYLMVLRAPQRFDGYLVLQHRSPVAVAGTMLPHLWRFLAYQIRSRRSGFRCSDAPDTWSGSIFGRGPSDGPGDGARLRRALP